MSKIKKLKVPLYFKWNCQEIEKIKNKTFEISSSFPTNCHKIQYLNVTDFE